MHAKVHGGNAALGTIKSAASPEILRPKDGLRMTVQANLLCTDVLGPSNDSSRSFLTVSITLSAT